MADWVREKLDTFYNTCEYDSHDESCIDNVKKAKEAFAKKKEQVKNWNSKLIDSRLIEIVNETFNKTS